MHKKKCENQDLTLQPLSSQIKGHPWCFLTWLPSGVGGRSIPVLLLSKNLPSIQQFNRQQTYRIWDFALLFKSKPFWRRTIDKLSTHRIRGIEDESTELKYTVFLR